MNENKLVSFIIVNLNGTEIIDKCLDSIYEQTYNNFEVLFVDNRSTDNSVEKVRSNYKHVKIIELDKNYGFGKANNIGIQNSNGYFVALINNDVFLDKYWLENIVKGIQSDKETGFCASKIINGYNKEYIDSAGEEINFMGWNYFYHGYHKNDMFVCKDRYCFSACAAAVLYKKEIIKQAGLFDDIYSPAYCEDLDLGFRIQIMGYKCRYVSNAIAYHYTSFTAKKKKNFQAYQISKNYEIYSLKNLPLFLYLVTIPVRFLYIFLFVRIFGIKNILSIVKGKIDFLGASRKVFKKRNKDKMNWKISTFLFLKKLHFSFFRQRVNYFFKYKFRCKKL